MILKLGRRVFSTVAARRKREWLHSFFLDERLGQRQIVLPQWLTRHSKRSIRIEVADESDYYMLAQFWTERFVTDCPLLTAIDTDYKDVIQLHYDMLEDILPQRNSYIALDGNRIVGCVFYQNLKFPKSQKPRDRTMVLRNDYGSVIADGPYNSIKANQISTILTECHANLEAFLPPHVEDVSLIVGCVTHPDYEREGLAQKLLDFGDKMQTGNQAVVGFAVAQNSWRIMQRLGYETIFTLPYSRFLENGKPVFGQIRDNAVGVHTVMRVKQPNWFQLSWDYFGDKLFRKFGVYDCWLKLSKRFVP